MMTEHTNLGQSATSEVEVVAAVLWRSGLGKLTRAECEVMAEQVIAALNALEASHGR